MMVFFLNNAWNNLNLAKIFGNVRVLSFKLVIMAGGSDVTEEIAPHSREKHAPF